MKRGRNRREVSIFIFCDAFNFRSRYRHSEEHVDLWAVVAPRSWRCWGLDRPPFRAPIGPQAVNDRTCDLRREAFGDRDPYPLDDRGRARNDVRDNRSHDDVQVVEVAREG